VAVGGSEEVAEAALVAGVDTNDPRNQCKVLESTSPHDWG
jgi:hypothetical protein